MNDSLTPAIAPAGLFARRKQILRRFFRLNYRQIYGILLISPWIIGFLLFKLLPILASLGLSFTNFHMLKPEETRFIGLENYARMFRDPAVGYLLFQTIALALGTVPLQLVASTLLAGLLSSPRLKASTLTRTLFFLPAIIPSVAILFMWQGFVDPATGWLNRFILQPIGLTGFNGVYTDGVRGLLFAISSLWSIGPGMLIMLGAMQGMDPDVHEAARVDGAGPLVRFFMITLPIISPALFFSLVINLIAVFGGVVLLDRGNVFSGSVSPFDGYISYNIFNQWQLGYAASLAWFFFLLVIILIVAIFASSRRWVYYPDREA